MTLCTELAVHGPWSEEGVHSTFEEPQKGDHCALLHFHDHSRRQAPIF